MRTTFTLRAGLAALLSTAACAATATPALADNPVKWGLNSGPYCTPSCDSAATGGQANNALLVDVDGNGSNELITTRYGQGFAPAVYVHEPQQGAHAIEAYYPITGGAGLKVVAGDLDRDGDPDLVVGSLSVSPEVLLNNGNGTFAAKTTVTAALSIGAMALADINGDGAPDLVYSRGFSTPALSYSPGRGDGTFDTEVTITTDATAKFTAMKLADLDGDGDLDIAGVRASVTSGDYTVPRVVVYRNAGDGSFPTFTIYDGIAGTYAGSSATATTSRALATGDYDGDGDLDLAFTGGTIGVGGSVSVLRNAGDGTFGGRTDYPLTGLTSVYALVAGDLDGDGDQDIITAGNVTASSFGGAVGHLLGQSNGTFAAHALPTGSSWYSISSGVLPDSGDYTGDGALDLAIPSSTSGTVSLLTGVKNPVAQTGVGKALISELRLSGPGGYGDQYVDVYNRSLTTPLNLGGWKLKTSSGASVRIEQGTMVPAGGHLLLTGPRRAALGWSLDDAGKSALQLPFGNVAANAGNGGVALIGPSGATVDAVGFGSVAAGYKEGTALTPVTALGELAFVRRFADGAPVDTGDNAADFVAVDTAADGSTSAQLGAPRPDHTTAPTVKNDFLQSTLLDPAKTASQSPNRVVGGGQLTVNRTIVNCSGTAKTDPATAAACVNAATTSGKTVTKLRFRITDLTTVGTPGTGKAVLKAVASSDATTDGFSTKGLPLDAPSASTGGGINSTLTATSLLPAGGLAPGQSINVAFTFTVATAGKFAFAYNTEDDLIEARDAAPEATPTPTPQADTPAAPAAAEPAVPVADAARGTIPQSAVTSAPAAAPKATTASKPATKATTSAKAKAKAKAAAKARAKQRAKQRAKCRTLKTKQRRTACLAKVSATTRR